jgi:hypothetical protein
MFLVVVAYVHYLAFADIELIDSCAVACQVD